MLSLPPPTCQGYSPKSASTVVPAGVLGSVPGLCFFLLIFLIFLTISEAAGSLSRAFSARSEEKTGMKTNQLTAGDVLLPRSTSCLSCRMFRMSSFLILL